MTPLACRVGFTKGCLDSSQLFLNSDGNREWAAVQSKLLVDQEIHQTTLATLKQAITDQEALITRLQQVRLAEVLWESAAQARITCQILRPISL